MIVPSVTSHDDRMDLGDNDTRLNNSQSYHESSDLPKLSQSKGYSKSDFHFSVVPTTSAGAVSGATNETYLACDKCHAVYITTNGDYYKKYEHDELPVKDSDSSVGSIIKGSLTNSDLDKMENRIFSNISQELQTEQCSLSSLESNIKFFKITVEKIFENFYTSMRDFELYKKRFHEILDRSKEGSMDDMEEFIKDMINHIMSSDNSESNIVSNSAQTIDGVDRKCAFSCGDSSVESENGIRIVEAYKNENYLTDSTFNSSKTKPAKIENLLNIFLLGCNPCVEIKLDGRNMLSEINIKKPAHTLKTENIASAENLKKLAAKKLELEKYIRQQHDGNLPDRDIPVRISNAKKNIHLNEDFCVRLKETEVPQSFFSKICTILCRKLRRSSVS